MTKTEIMNEATKLYKALDRFVKITGLHYNDDGEYKVKLRNFKCDYEMLASIENAHADLRYYLGK